MMCAHGCEMAWYIYLGYMKKFILAKPMFLSGPQITHWCLLQMQMPRMAVIPRLWVIET